MAPAIKEQLFKLVDHIPGLRSRRNAMAEASERKPTDNLKHRYADQAVLRKALIDMGIKDKDINIWATESTGLDVELPRQLTRQEKEAIYKKFEEAEYARRVPPEGDDDDGTD
ncbi:hypothetical protein F4782DRAFT_372527 [Xylaria castorea]|nr:hypothetical protein F4782DRAFT_372527 [Xylaria castorea]